MKIYLQIKIKVLPLYQEITITHTEMSALNYLTQEQALNLISRQANELMKSGTVQSLLNECNTENEKKEMLLIATLYSIMKANN